MSTSITASMVVAALQKWGVPFRTYRSDWASHNRNHKQAFGPINGFMVHNFGSDASDPNSLRYLNSGDLARGMPGPLSQFAITDDGVVWLMAWGTSNHGGEMDLKTHALVVADKMPLDRDVRPTTSGNSPDSLTLQSTNAHYVGVEMTYGTAPTAAQRRSVTLLGAALMDLLGPGFTGGSVVGHRESTTARSDPVGMPMYQLRREINALLARGPAGSTPKPPTSTPAPQPPKPPTQENTNMALTTADAVRFWSADVLPAAFGTDTKTNPNWSAQSYFFYTHKAAAEARDSVKQLRAEMKAMEERLIAAIAAQKPAG